MSTLRLADRNALVEPESDPLRVVRQWELLGVSRSSFYDEPVALSEEELELCRLLEQQYLETPFYGSRRLTVWLQKQGYCVNRKRVQRLMRQLGLEALYPQPKLSQRHPEHEIYPYLLNGVKVTQADQVWSTDITYLPVLKGHYYLVAILDWYSRKVLSWRISNTLEVEFRVAALEAALLDYGKPEIFNKEVTTWVDWYNEERSHQALEYKTPNEVYRNSKLTLKELQS